MIAAEQKARTTYDNILRLSDDPDVKFENIHFADSLLTLSYRIANR